jgi:hypothetical protein
MFKSTNKPDPSIVRSNVYIVSVGIKHPTYTMHDFAGFKLEPDPDVGWLRPQWAVNYKCRTTGRIRKFGVIDATPASDDERNNEEVMS